MKRIEKYATPELVFDSCGIELTGGESLMIDYRSEYRINKGNCECFRTDTWEKLIARLELLRRNYPRAEFTTQRRQVRIDKYGNSFRDYKGRPEWSPWN